MNRFRWFLTKLKRSVIPNLAHLRETHIRRCRCCGKTSIFISLSAGEERKICLRCGANLRFEMLAELLRHVPLSGKVVVEMDPRSPLARGLFYKIADTGKHDPMYKYIRTFYSLTIHPGTISKIGARCEDITRTTFSNESIDVLISSDVLEHVADIDAAFREMYRILRPGGCYFFTVPPRDKTYKRAEIIDGQIFYFTNPEYHSDPLNQDGGILSYWDFGTDAISLFQKSGLKVSIALGPEGKDKRLVWVAEKPMSLVN